MQKTILFALLAVFLSLPGSAPAVESPELGAVALHQALLDLGNDFRLMCVAAHPDDEDGATLAYYRMKYGVKTYAVIATRGEGGQNEIGPELYEDLAAIRTEEMQAAAKIEGAELHFLDLPEFGFSKSIEETFEKWGHEEALRRMVLQIRMAKPHVIITHHGRLKDHGHHQAIGQIVQEAFDAAADPQRFPEQVEKLGTWQVKRLFIRNWEGGQGGAEIPIHELEPVRGLTYAEIAAEALRAHHSQGMGFFIDRLLNEQDSVWYDLVKGEPVVEPDGSPSESGALFSGLAAEQQPRSARDKRTQLIAVVKGLELRVEPSDKLVVPGQKLDLKITVVDHSASGTSNPPFLDIDSERIKKQDLAPLLNETALLRTLGVGGSYGHFYGSTPSVWRTEKLSISMPEDMEPTFPGAAHLREPQSQQLAYTLWAQIDWGGEGCLIHVPISLGIAAPVELAFVDAPYLMLLNNACTQVIVKVVNHRPQALETRLAVMPDPGLSFSSAEFPVRVSDEDGQSYVSGLLRGEGAAKPGSYLLHASDSTTGTRAETKVQVVDLRSPGEVMIGVVTTYDTTFVNTLQKLGIRYEAIDTPGKFADLAQFTTILVDMRAYQYRKDLIANNARLLDYVKQGGNAVVMYQKDFDWKPEYAPYPLRVSRNRVTREEAPVTLLAPEHPLFNHPNKIGPADWEGWVQERGLYFPDEWDPHYTPLLEMQDPGESNPPGALLAAKYGEGNYTYCSLVLYRQLRALNPGALRLFVNLIALKPQ